MNIFEEKIKISTEKGIDIINLTDNVEEKIKENEIKQGLCVVFNPGSTASIILNEDEPMLKEDLKDEFEELISSEEVYHHPSNAYSHLRALLLGPSQIIPIKEGGLKLGKWQEIMLVEMDVKPRERKISIMVIGE